MSSKGCLFNRKMAFNGHHCPLIDFSDGFFSPGVSFCSTERQTPYMFKIFLSAAVRYSIFQSFRCMNFFKKVVYVAYVSILMLCET